MTATTETTTGVGRVARVTGPVVDVEFPVEAMPELYNALHVEVSFDTGEEGGGSDERAADQIHVQGVKLKGRSGFPDREPL